MMWFSVIIIFLLLQINIFLRADDSHCHTPSLTDFVRDSLPKICFGSESAGVLNYSMDSVQFYNAHCRIYQEIKQCLDTKLKRCDEIRAGFNRHILNLIESYQLPLEYFDYDKKVYDDNHYLQNLIPFCDGDKLSNHFLQQFDRSLLNCLTKTTLNKHKECLTTFKQNIHTILQTKTSLNEITKWSEDFLRCIYNSIPTSCPTATKEVFVFKELLAVPDKHNESTSTSLNIMKIVKQKLPSQIVEAFAQSKRATSSIHGDPHILQLHTNKPITCRLLHNRTYLSNPHFKITGVSKHVGDPELTATAITSLQIDFFDSNGSLISYYKVSNGKLPLELIYFDSLASSIIKIDYSEKHATEGHIALIHVPTSTQIIVNRWAKFYFFAVRSSELLLNNSDGYLITGCPQNEIIDRQAIIARLKERFAQSQRQVVVGTTRQRRHILLEESQLPNECERICSSNDNEFPDECIFDCLAIASVNATQALHVNQMHIRTSRERRQLVDNDKRVVREFEQCYTKGLACKITHDPDESNHGERIIKQTSLLTISCFFIYYFTI
ncbi:unnamed protein product [Rotaria magnacalcarata]|uniref:Repulsive guidance molecule C-terminal domain-containing protein n=3 Tax=Rotaria magnacalcarata TaxID=392030 RepID=A0A816SX00_9BILA|nr:unnamed protein product [Rotaria magnacalcarata]CAF2088922.1 unnamed protein product [Rotaria magnacalcarata]